MLEFENYHCHSYFSNPLTQPDSTMSPEDYAKIYQQRNMHVLCLSEHGNRSDIWRQADVCAKYKKEGYDMKPIAAAECYFVPDRNPELKDNRNFHLVVVAKNNDGLRQLNKMLSGANTTGFYGKARVDYDLLSRLDYRNFLVTTACVGGPLKDENGIEYCKQLHELFRENFYLEIQHHPQQIQIEHNQKILSIYQKYGWPLIYGTDSHYIHSSDAILRKELLLSAGINNGYEDEFDLYLPTADQAYRMLLSQNIFSKSQIEEAFHNTLQLRTFDGVSFNAEKKIPVSRKDLTLEQRNHLYKKSVCDGYIKKAGMPTPYEAKELHAEMNAVVNTGTADYFIAAKDIVEKAKDYGGIITNTGRGSAVSFATNFALGFTDVNRLRIEVQLYPERFITEERLKKTMPDLDINLTNVEAFRRAARDIFGEHGCYPMVAYGTNKTLSAFKLLARARNLDFDTSNAVSKQISIYELDRKHAIENNADDPDYNVDDDIDVSDYVDREYLDLINDSKQYRGIVTSLSPHPCAHLIFDHDIEEEFGVIRTKAKTGNKEAVYCAYVDGATADAYGYLKLDFLRVDVVKTIAQTFKMAGVEQFSVDELRNRIQNDRNIWQLYADGFTLGLNQCEKFATTQKVMSLKPKNIVELCAFVAAVRPGFKSRVNDFITRSLFKYGIPALDEMLVMPGMTGPGANSSYLEFDEQILFVLQQAGISPSESYACLKAVKKKKADKVAAYKEQFKTGFKQVLVDKEGASEESAEQTTEQIWTIIQDAASYMFCRAHAYCMACDSLYGAYQKLHYPYEFYAVQLKLYSEKGNREKVSLLISEMKRYKNIRMIPGQFGQDNRDWYIDKEAGTISQSLSSIKYISKIVAEELYAMKDMKFDTFTDILRYLQMNTSIDARQIKTLIHVGYFRNFGKTGKLMSVFDEFFKGKNKLTKQIKSFEKRLAANREYEQSTKDEPLPISATLFNENDLLGLCITVNESMSDDDYYVTDVDDKYGVKLNLYSIKRGTSGQMKMSKRTYADAGTLVNEIIHLDKWSKRQRCIYRDKKRIPIPDEFESWVEKYRIVS